MAGFTEVTNQDLEELEMLLREAIGKAEEIAHSDGGRLKQEMEAYLIPHLTSWVQDERQMGSIPNLMASLDEMYNEEDDDEE
jgi:hypothetical protein